MKRISKTEVILEFLRGNSGLATAAQLSALHLSGGHINVLLKSGRIVKAARGVYMLPDSFEDEFVNLQARLRKGVFFCETALYLNGLTDRTPDVFRMAFPLSYNTSKIDASVLPTRMKIDLHELGKTMVTTPGGHDVVVYDIEKTLCDILRPVNHVGVNEVSHAFKLYARSRARKLNTLSEYAAKLHVEARLRSYLEVLV